MDMSYPSFYESLQDKRTQYCLTCLIQQIIYKTKKTQNFVKHILVN